MQTSAQIHQLLHNTHQQQMDDSMVSALSLPFDASTPSSSGQPPLFSPNSSDACTGGSRAAQSSTTEGSEKLLANSFLLDQNDEKPSQMADGKGMIVGTTETATTARTSVEVEDAAEEKEKKLDEVAVIDGVAEKETVEEIERPSEKSAKEEEEANSEERRRQNWVESKTTDLIRKQLAEIEREITRRMQNKNVKKMDEQEMNQLLLNHGFGLPQHQPVEEANGDGRADQQQQKSALPFGDTSEPKLGTDSPSLDQLSQSLINPQPPVSQHPLYFPQPFIPGGQMPFSIAGAHFPHQQTLATSFLAQMCPPEQFAMPQPFAAPSAGLLYQSPHHPIAGSAISVPFLPQQSTPPTVATQSPSPPFAQMLPPSLSDITPEMAAQLLAQLQQQNPSLIQNLVVGQQQQHQQQQSQPAPSAADSPWTGTSPVNNGPLPLGERHNTAPAPLPAPPRGPQSSVANRRTSAALGPTRKSFSGVSGTAQDLNGGHAQRQTMEWAGDSGVEKGGTTGEKTEPVWVMRESYLKRREREEQRRLRKEHSSRGKDGDEAEAEGEETDKLLLNGRAEGARGEGGATAEENGGERSTAKTTAEEGEEHGTGPKRKGSKKEVIIHEPAVLIEGVLFRARYLGSTQMSSDGRHTKSSRMAQAQEAVARVKAPDGELQPSTEIDLFISTEKIMVLNTDLQRISETDVRQDILMDHSLRSISYIADIGDLVVLMARRVPSQQEQAEDDAGETIRKTPRVICHIFESDESAFIAQSIGQAFQVAYVEFLRANGIEDPNYLRDIDYQEVLNSQELLGEELEMLARKETQKDVVVSKKSGETLGVVVVESGWGSMLPTVVIANMAPRGGRSRSNHLNIGDQLIGINGISLVGLPLSAAQQNIKNVRSSTAVRLTVVSTPPVVEVRIRRPDTKYQLGFSVIANMAPGGAASRSNHLNIGDQLIGINGISLVGLPLSAAQQNIKNVRSSTAVRLTVVSTPPVVEVRIRRPDTKYQLGFSVQNGVICSLLRGGIAERGGIRVGHRIIEINHLSVVAIPHERIVNMLATATGEIHMKTMPTSMFRLLTGQEVPNYI
uniref:PDZ domain-containing protein n=1 Tax=Globodera pallida TaxID=36090 RepID=A0A183BLB9_GLOPA